MAQSPVSARTVLRAIMQLKRQGITRLLVGLEQEEPDLAEYFLEEVTRIYHSLLELGGEARPTRRVQQQIEAMALVCIRSLRSSGPEPAVRSSPASTRKRKGR